ncbi:hypothetical protein CPB85DRAFT_161922 [Mucidula mucida]|nr:hypothetical protein CPB85DRAFT_161922 [Mucidula mucida]
MGERIPFGLQFPSLVSFMLLTLYHDHDQTANAWVVGLRKRTSKIGQVDQIVRRHLRGYCWRLGWKMEEAGFDRPAILPESRRRPSPCPPSKHT